MNILLCGADGFLGRHLELRLTNAGHRVARGVRRPRRPGDVAIDYLRDTEPAAWLDRLEGIDAVVNAVGILVETPAQPFTALHEKAPQALFDACVLTGIDRVVQISALGADRPTTPYLATKAAADAHLARLPLQWAVVRPSLVYGDDGASSRFLRSLASLPVIGLPGRGEQMLQPIHVDDLCDCVLALVATPGRRIVELGGPRALSYRQLLATYRRALGFDKALWLPIPMALMNAAARVAERLGQRVLSRDTMAMLARGNVSARRDAAMLLGHAPRDPDDFIAPDRRRALRAESVSAWGMPLLRVALAMVWCAAGALSLWFYPRPQSLALLSAVGLSGAPAFIALYAASTLDLALALLTLAWPSRLLWLSQALLICCYSVVIAAALPEFWLHPFGPLVKNLPLLAMLTVLFAMEDPKWTT